MSGVWTRDTGGTEGQTHATSSGFGKEVGVLILWICSVTWGRHYLLFGDGEMVSFIGRKKQGKT